MDFKPLLQALRDLYESMTASGKPDMAKLLNAIGVLCVALAAFLRKPSEPQPPEPVFGSYGVGDDDGDEVVRLCCVIASDLTGKPVMMAPHGAPRHIAIQMLLDAIVEYLAAQGFDSVFDLIKKLLP